MNTDLIERVRARLAGGGTPASPSAVATAVREEAGGPVADADLLTALRSLQQEFLGTGVVEPLLRDPEVTDVLVTAPDEVWVDRGDGLCRSAVTFSDEEAVRRLAQRLAVATGRRLDEAQPWVDGWLPGAGAGEAVRMHAVLPPIAVNGTCLSLRILRPASHGVDALLRMGTFSPELGAVLRSIVRAKLALLVTGGTGAGKTTLLRTVSGLVRCSAGRVTLGGEDITSAPVEAMVGKGMAHVPEGRGVIAGPAGGAKVEVGHGLEEGGAAAATRGRVRVLEEADPLVHGHVARRRVVQVAQEVLGQCVVEPRDLLEELVDRRLLSDMGGARHGG